MDFPFGQTVFRDRRTTTANPHNPSRPVEGDWDPALTIQIDGAFVAASSTSGSSATAVRDATRSQLLTSKSLYLSDPTADVLPRDRIRVGGSLGDMSSGIAYLVEVFPDADVNPFTGWQPVAEVPLENVRG